MVPETKGLSLEKISEFWHDKEETKNLKKLKKT
jgi:hypothetical protein